jgi:hypothetical protein
VGEWVPVERWEEEVPQRCTVCNETFVGRELGYVPVMCELEDCPGTTKRIYEYVKVDK